MKARINIKTFDLGADFDLFRDLLGRISSEAALKNKKRPGKLTDLQRHHP